MQNATSPPANDPACHAGIAGRLQCRAGNTQYGKDSGFAPIKLFVIVVLGAIIGAGAYVLYKNPTKFIPRLPTEKVIEPGGTTKTTKPTTEQAVETGGSKQSTKPEPTTKSETSSAKGNFSKKGAVVAREDGWMLIWDEPGRMAMNAKLKFTDQSTCILGGEKKDCGLINMGPQNYDYASVEGNKTDGEVTVIKLEELKLPQ